MSAKHLDTRVIVRKVSFGPAPYGWEVYDGASSLPYFVCPDRYKSMQAAYEAGQTWLADCTAPTERPQPRQQRVRQPSRPVSALRTVETDWSNDIDDETDGDVLLDDEVDQRCGPVCDA